jgi:hypothetical protein
MTIQRHRPDKSDRSSRKQDRLSRFNPSAVALGLSLLSLVGSGWLKSGGLKLAISGAAAVLLVGALVKIFRALDFSSPRLVNGTPRQLAWIRIVVCLTALIYTLIENLPAIASMPAEMRNDNQFFHVLNSLPGYSTLLSSPYLLATLQWTTAVLLFSGLIGFLTRPTLFLGSLGFFLMQAILRHYTYQYHSGLVLIYLVLVITWTPCAATWSIDSWLNHQKPPPGKQSVGFSVYACFAVMAIVYVLSGLSKLRGLGLDWFRGDNIEPKLVSDALSPIFFDYKWKATIWLVQHHAPGYVFAIIGTIGLIVELGYVTVLFSRTAQIILPIAALGVHVGILVFQHILFPDLLMLQLIFLNVDWVTNFCGRHFQTGDRAASAQVRNDIPPRPLSYLPAVATALMVAIFFVAWVWSVEYYPLSSWGMYSYAQRKGPLHYLKVIATLENGRSIVIPTRDFSPAWLPSGRDILARVFRTTRHSEKFDAFLSFYVQRRNRNLMFGSPITRMEIQIWRWNYLVDPNDPRFGWAIGVYPYDVPSRPSPSR